MGNITVFQYDEMFELARLAIQLGTTDNNVSVVRFIFLNNTIDD